MKYKTLGKTNLEVSALSLGTWGIGGAGWDEYTKEQRLDAVQAAVQSGINFIDTAPAYNGGAAEKVVGEALEKIGARKNVVISTKCGNDFINGKYIHNGSRANILRECDESLKNLRTDYIDVYLVHWPDPNVPFEETFGALNDLQKAGKILHIGVSNFSQEQILEAEELSKIEVFQPQYSMVFREQEALTAWAAERNIGIMAYGALGGGILTGAYREYKEYPAMDSRNRFYKHFHEPMFSKVQKLLCVMDEISAEHDNVPLSHIALNWTAEKSFISSAIVGSQSRKKIEENAAAFDFSLSAEEIQRLDAAIAALDE